MIKIAWLTDIHLNFLTLQERRCFYQTIIDSKADAVLISGDIAEAPSVKELLPEMEHALNKSIYFVMGNHDYYRGSIESVRLDMAHLSNITQRLKWLSVAGVQKLSEDVLLVGTDGFADGRYGDYENSPVSLNDSRLIADFFQAKLLSRDLLLTKMQHFADEDAKQLFRDIETVVELHNPRKIIVLTHVPPFPYLCLYEGKQSDDYYLPYFSSKATGDVLLEIANKYPLVGFMVLCGHTHHYAQMQVLPNLNVKVGSAEYYSPKIHDIILL